MKRFYKSVICLTVLFLLLCSGNVLAVNTPLKPILTLLPIKTPVPLPTAPPALQINLLQTSTNNSVYLNWIVSGNTDQVNGYWIHRTTHYGSLSGNPLNSPVVVTGTTYTDSTVTTGTTYYYVVSIQNKDFSSGPASNWVTVTPGVLPPQATLSVTGINKEVSLSWSVSGNSSQILKYLIYRRTTPTGNPSLLGSVVSGTVYKDTQVTLGTTYYYQVVPMMDINTPGAWSNQVSATPRNLLGNTIVLQIGNPKMTVNGIQMEIDPGRGTVPVVINGTTMVPIRAIIEAMGGTVQWDNTTRKITVKLNSNTIQLWLNSKIITVNNKNKIIAVPPQLIKGRTMVPLKVIVENLGLKLQWNALTKTITISDQVVPSLRPRN
jgi:hypothetical protein